MIFNDNNLIVIYQKDFLRKKSFINKDGPKMGNRYNTSLTLVLISRQQLHLGKGHHHRHQKQYIVQGQHRRPILQLAETFKVSNRVFDPYVSHLHHQEEVSGPQKSMAPDSSIHGLTRTEIKRKLSSLLIISQVIIHKSKSFDKVDYKKILKTIRRIFER